MSKSISVIKFVYKDDRPPTKKPQPPQTKQTPEQEMIASMLPHVDDEFLRHFLSQLGPKKNSFRFILRDGKLMYRQGRVTKSYTFSDDVAENLKGIKGLIEEAGIKDMKEEINLPESVPIVFDDFHQAPPSVRRAMIGCYVDRLAHRGEISYQRGNDLINKLGCGQRLTGIEMKNGHIVLIPDLESI